MLASKNRSRFDSNHLNGDQKESIIWTNSYALTLFLACRSRNQFCESDVSRKCICDFTKTWAPFVVHMLPPPPSNVTLYYIFFVKTLSTVGLKCHVVVTKLVIFQWTLKQAAAWHTVHTVSFDWFLSGLEWSSVY